MSEPAKADHLSTSLTRFVLRTVRSGRPLAPAGRVSLFLGSLLLIFGFGVAASLEPDPSGLGTHRQLGLPPCSIRDAYGVPCPNCGMTTSFSHTVRGQFPSAIRANPAGFLLAIACAGLVPWTLISAACGRTCGVDRPIIPLTILLGTVLVLSIVNWIWRLRYLF